MKVLQLLPISNLDGGLLLELGPMLADIFRVPCDIIPKRLDPEFAFYNERQQYHSSEIATHANVSERRFVADAGRCGR